VPEFDLWASCYDLQTLQQLPFGGILVVLINERFGALRLQSPNVNMQLDLRSTEI
jgi:hypothetical protein